MGGGGSIASMNSTIRNNQKLSARRKARVKKVRNYFLDQKAKRKTFHDKEVSAAEMAEIKQQIRKKAARRKRIYLIATVSALVLTALFFIELMTM